MKTSIIMYAAIWVIALSIAALGFAEIIELPTKSEISDGTLAYMLSISTICLSLITAYVAMRVFNLSVIKMYIIKAKPEQQDSRYHFICRLRMIAIAITIFFDTATYFLTANTSNHYLSAIMLVALMFCCPRQSELNDLTNITTSSK